MNTTTSTSTEPTFTAFDRCDRCGARAKVQVRLPGGGELIFCAHHGREHRAELTRRGAELRGPG